MSQKPRKRLMQIELERLRKKAKAMAAASNKNSLALRSDPPKRKELNLKLSFGRVVKNRVSDYVPPSKRKGAGKLPPQLQFIIDPALIASAPLFKKKTCSGQGCRCELMQCDKGDIPGEPYGTIPGDPYHLICWTSKEKWLRVFNAKPPSDGESRTQYFCPECETKRSFPE